MSEVPGGPGQVGRAAGPSMQAAGARCSPWTSALQDSLVSTLTHHWGGAQPASLPAVTVSWV